MTLLQYIDSIASAQLPTKSDCRKAYPCQGDVLYYSFPPFPSRGSHRHRLLRTGYTAPWQEYAWHYLVLGLYLLCSEILNCVTCRFDGVRVCWEVVERSRRRAVVPQRRRCHHVTHVRHFWSNTILIYNRNAMKCELWWWPAENRFVFDMNLSNLTLTALKKKITESFHSIFTALN